jgi:hypothetical protein
VVRAVSAAGNGFAGHAWRIAVSMTSFLHHKIPWNDAVEFLSRHHLAQAPAPRRVLALMQ